MCKILSLSLSPEVAAFDESINNRIRKELNSNDIEPSHWKILKKSIDAKNLNHLNQTFHIECR